MHLQVKRFSFTVFLAMMVAVVMVPATATPSSAATTGFRDVKGNHQFYKEIAWMTQNNITTGYAFDDTFRPKENVSREAFAAFLYRIAGKPAVRLPANSPFKDVPKNAQFYKEIVWLSQQKITTGWSDNTFRPKWTIARDAMAAFLYRFEGRPSFTPPSSSPFKDVPRSQQFYKEITWLAHAKITTGYADNTYRPYSGSSREATAAFLFRGHAPAGYKAPAYKAPNASYNVNEMLRVARSQVGYRQPGWQQNKYNTWIGANYAWCSVYVSWVFNKSGHYGFVPEVNHFNTYLRMVRESGVLKTNVSTSSLKPGDVVFIDWPPYGSPTHTGIVHYVSGNGVYLYEGNTTDGTGNNGRGVFHRWRSINYVWGSFDPMAYYNATR
ncbi:MAG: S-layer homology domain-containing protein [Demequina sp.]